jgi:branched-chain amino acid transport system substrate-binding protein
MAVGPIASTAGAKVKSDRKPITVGVAIGLTAPSGPSTWIPRYQAFLAVVNWANAHGGVNGHKIELVTADDAGSATQNQTAVQSMVQNRGALMVVDATNPTGTGGGANWLSQNGIPAVAVTSTPCTLNYTFYCPIGGDNPDSTLGNTSDQKFLKSVGGHTLGAIALQGCASCAQVAQSQVNAAPLVGMAKGYINTTVPAGTTNWTPFVLGLQNSNTDAIEIGLDIPTALSFVLIQRQQGLNAKILSTTLFVASLLTNPASAYIMNGIYVRTQFNPNLNSKPVKTMIRILKKYGAPEDPIQSNNPAGNEATGYMMGLLTLEMLKRGGVNPTRPAIMKNMDRLTNWDAGGMVGYKVNFALEHTASAPLVSGPCEWYLQARGTQFVVLNRQKPICTPTVRLIGN